MKSIKTRVLTLGTASLLALFSSMSCHQSRNANGSGEDSKVDSTTASGSPHSAEAGDTIPMPIYLTPNGQYLQMLYWTDVIEPPRNDEYPEYYEERHALWSAQETLRRRLSQYTHLVEGDKLIDIRYYDEVLKDPDGNTPSIGQLHGRPEIPSLCARFVPTDARIRVEDLAGMVAVTDSYLNSRKKLAIDFTSSSDATLPAFPDSILRKVEQQYGMKVSRSVWCTTIGGRYMQGCLQFEGEYRNAPKDDNDYKKSLALEVLVDSGRVYACEQIGYFISPNDFGWNVDDGGEYIPSSICAAFQGPKGVELCYWRGAPESLTVGMYVLRDGRYEQQNFDMYQYMIDEEIPVWKSDIAEMQRLYSAWPEYDDVALTLWGHCYVDFENEWIWLRDKDQQNGAIFLRKDGRYTLIGVETPQIKPSTMDKDNLYYIRFAASGNEMPMSLRISAFRKGELVEQFSALEANGIVANCELNGKPISEDEGRAYLDGLTGWTELNTYFHNPDEQ